MKIGVLLKFKGKRGCVIIDGKSLTI